MVRLSLSLGFLVCLSLSLVDQARAHHPVFGSLVVHVRPEQVDVLMDLDAEIVGKALRLDSDGNNVASPDEIEAGREAVLAYLGDVFSIKNADKPCPLKTVERFGVGGSVDKPRLQVLMVLACPRPLGMVTIEHRALMEEAGGHRHMAQIQVGERVYSHVFVRQVPTFEVDASGLEPVVKEPPKPTVEPWVVGGAIGGVALLFGVAMFVRRAGRRAS